MSLNEPELGRYCHTADDRHTLRLSRSVVYEPTRCGQPITTAINVTLTEIQLRYLSCARMETRQHGAEWKVSVGGGRGLRQGTTRSCVEVG
jgi:hypothetical protein